MRSNLKEIGVPTRNWVDSAQDRGYWRTLEFIAFIIILTILTLKNYI